MDESVKNINLFPKRQARQKKNRTRGKNKHDADSASPAAGSVVTIFLLV